jgi:hypothetical protein
MANQQLIKYIKKRQKQKISGEEIEKTLMDQGWSADDIYEASRKKFLIPMIVVVCILIIGGGILAYQYWWLPKQEEPITEPLVTEEPEKEEKEVISTVPEVMDKKEETAQSEEETPQPEEILPEEKIDIIEWRTYKNEEYEFELKYPENWTLEERERDETNTIVEIYPIDGLNCEKLFGEEICLDNIFIQVLDNEEDLEIETLLSKFYEKWIPKNFQDLEIGGRTGVKYDTYEPYDGSFQYNSAVEIDGKIIILTGSHLVYEETLIFDQVLFSFKFVGIKAITEIRLGVDAPFSIATIAITYQGYMTYEAFAPALGIEGETDTGKIASEQYNELVNLIINNNFFSFEESYIEEGLADATTYTIIVKQGKETKSVSCYGECPEKIIEIRNKIKELWGKEILEV